MPFPHSSSRETHPTFTALPTFQGYWGLVYASKGALQRLKWLSVAHVSDLPTSSYDVSRWVAFRRLHELPKYPVVASQLHPRFVDNARLITFYRVLDHDFHPTLGVLSTRAMALVSKRDLFSPSAHVHAECFRVCSRLYTDIFIFDRLDVDRFFNW